MGNGEWGMGNEDSAEHRSVRNAECGIHHCQSGAQILREPLPAALGDARQLVQVLQNLLGNAIKLRRPGQAPEIRVSAVRRQSYWLFTVRDNGIGIDPRHAARIFRKRYRLIYLQEDDWAQWRRDLGGSGSGTGAAICFHSQARELNVL